MYNTILEQIHQILGNLVLTCNITKTFVDDDDLWSGSLSAAAFVILSTTNGLKGYIPGKLVFGHDLILHIKRRVDWKLIG